jgi:glycosyltransferase involved in cell wall biosynthesis
MGDRWQSQGLEIEYGLLLSRGRDHRIIPKYDFFVTKNCFGLKERADSFRMPPISKVEEMMNSAVSGASGIDLPTRRRIAIMGTRGIPAAYGGFETFAEELSTRLVECGYEVTVYGRSRFFQGRSTPEMYKGVHLRTSPTIFHKYLETPLSALTAFTRFLWKRPAFDCILLCNAANSPFAWIPRLLGIPLTINVDGIERMRAKWNHLGKLWYLIGERCAVLFANRVVSDARVIAQYYSERYGIDSEIIAYGAKAVRREAGPTLEKFQLTSKNYILYVSRLEPENNALGVIEAYKKSGIEIPLVIVGDAPYATEYKQQLRDSAAGKKVLFTGYQFGEAYQELQTHCLLYIQATEVGGTHPALIESMAYGNCVVANGTPENTEVLGEAGRLYRKNDFEHLAEILKELVTTPEEQERLRNMAKQRAHERYNWELVVEQYKQLFEKLIHKHQ